MWHNRYEGVEIKNIGEAFKEEHGNSNWTPERYQNCVYNLVSSDGSR